jgi:hypothetical protein
MGEFYDEIWAVLHGGQGLSRYVPVNRLEGTVQPVVAEFESSFYVWAAGGEAQSTRKLACYCLAVNCEARLGRSNERNKFRRFGVVVKIFGSEVICVYVHLGVPRK